MGRALIVVMAAVAAVLVLGVAAGAQPSQQQVEQCMQIPDEDIGRGHPECIFDAEGNLISRNYPGEAGPGAGLGGFFVLALLWAGIPLVIAGVVASSREESVGVAVLLTLVLGWIGLAIVVFGQRKTVESVARAAGTVTAGAAPYGAAGTGPAHTGPPDSSDMMAQRLRRLDDMHAQGVINDEERAARRAAILNEI